MEVIHLDAHTDTAVNFGGSRISDASLLQVATCEGLIDPERTIQIGLPGRGVIRGDFSHDSDKRLVLVDEVQTQGVQAIVDEARNVIGTGRCYLTIDTGVIDCAEMPGTTLPEPSGLTGREVRDLIRGLRGLDLVAAELVELSPMFDPTGKSACPAVGLAFEMLCVLSVARVSRTGLARKTHWHK